MVEETFICTEIWKDREALITFLKGQDACHAGDDDFNDDVSDLTPSGLS